MSKPITIIPPFKSLPSEQTPPYIDPFRKIHARNLELIKKRKLEEKRQIAKDAQEKRLNEIKEERINTANALERYRLLNIV